MEDRYLFKAKRIDNGEWVQGNLVYSEDSEDGWETLIILTRESNMFTKDGSKGNLGFENWYRVDQDTICQCTGLRDKNNKLIWENDIVKVKYSDNFEEITEVAYSKNGYSPYSNEYGCEDCCSEREVSEVEVIGNIFDNKELLESEG